jgi:transmembrane sensor
MDREQFKKLIIKYLNRKATELEKDFLDTYYNRFDSEPLPHLSETRATEMENELFRRIKDTIEDNNQVTVVRKMRIGAFRVAASILVLIGLSWLIYSSRNEILDRIVPVHQATISVPLGEIKTLVLADGTRVVLNAGSKLSYPEVFRGDNRIVELEGEGFFDVSHDASKPFIIGTDSLQVQVLGTSFNVKAYKDDANAEVSVLSGKVAVTSLSKNDRQQKIILPLQKISYNLSTGALEHSACASDEITDWQSGVLNFKNRTLGEIIPILERKYQIQVEVGTPLNDCRIYARIGNETADVTLNTLAKLLNGKVLKTGSNYRLSGVSCDEN